VDAPPATPASEAPARPAPERAARRAPPPPQPVPEPAAPAASDALVPAHEAAASEAALPALRDFEGEIVVDVPSIEPVGASPGAGLEPIAPVGAGPVTTTGIPASAAERAARCAELVAAIARDEEALKAHVSSPDAGPLVASPELRAIAERLPALQAELRALDAQSASP
jgi:hypothetical protein